MDSVEKAIRSALEKGDSDDRGFREAVYRRAFAALERAIDNNPSVIPDVAAKRRAAVQAKIAEIESEFIPAVPAVDAPVRPVAAPQAPSPRVDPPASPRPDAARAARTDGTPTPRVDIPSVDGPRAQPAPPPARQPTVAAGRVEPSFSSTPVRNERAEPRLDIEGTESSANARAAIPAVEVSAAGPIPEAHFPNLDDFGAPGVRASVPEDDAGIGAAGESNQGRRRRGRGRLAGLFLIATLLAALAIGAWWGWSTGLFKSPSEIDTSVPNPPTEPESEDFIPEEENNAPQMPGEADAARNWIPVFSPSDPTTVNAPAGTSAEVMQDDGGPFLRVRSDSNGSTIVFDVGQGTLEQIIGKQATFDIIARSEEGQETQFSVECNFGELGDCGRKRYAAGLTKGDFLFDIDMPDKRPGAAGTIAVNPDITNGGKALDIYEIRVSAE